MGNRGPGHCPLYLVHRIINRTIQFSVPFTPCVEVGWRLAFEHWGYGYATEAARLALSYGFGILALSEVVSYTSATNHRSRAVMERLGMRRDPAEDFDYPSLPEGHSPPKACPLQARFGFIFRHALTSRSGPAKRTSAGVYRADGAL
jgi:hypothetical protein